MTRSFLGTALCLVAFLGASVAIANPDGIMALSATEDAEGGTQADLSLPMLKAIEKRTVDLFTAKTKAALKAQGQSTGPPPLQVASHYVEIKGRKLAVIKISAPRQINQVFLYGVVGKEFRRVACIRTSDVDLSIPLFYGTCGEKVKEVFGVSPQ